MGQENGSHHSTDVDVDIEDLAAVAVGAFAAVKTAQKIAQKEDLSADLTNFAKVGAAGIGGYAAVKLTQEIAGKKKPSPDLETFAKVGAVVIGACAYSSISQKTEAGGKNMGTLMTDEVPAERNPSTCRFGLVLKKELEDEPWCLSPGKKLETWHNNNIQLGTEEFASDCRSAIDSVVRHIHRKSSSNILDFDVDKVVKGGSLGKGTMVKGLSDVDLVAFVNKPYLKPIAEIQKDDYKETLSRIISNVTSTLRGVANVQIIRSDQYLVSFKIQVGSRWIDVDLLFTTENVPHFQSSYRNMVESMLDVGHGTRAFYSASFVQHQVQFVKEKPGHVKELIRLVKYWASKYLPEKLQKSYPLELIIIYLWEKAGKPGRRLSKARGLRSVFEVLTKLDRLRVYWSYMPGVDYQLNETIIRKLDMKRPIILDPANPTNNVGYMYQWGNNKEVIEAAAERTLRTTLLSDVTAW